VDSHAEGIKLVTLGQKKRQIALIAGLLAAVVALALLWSRIPWEWSTIDDPGFPLLLQDLTEQGSLAGLPISVFLEMLAIDLDWGLFRPSYWLYPLTYLLPVSWMHVLRLVMLVVAIAGPLVALRKQRSASWSTVIAAGALVVLASTALTRGLFFLSLQELSGAAFVGLGLMTSRRGVRTTMWLVAAWFKIPFAWLLIGHALVLWRSGAKKAAVVNGILGLGSLGVAAVFSLNGNYTTRYLRPTIWGNIDAIFNNIQQLFGVLGGLLMFGTLWWLLLSATRLRPSRTAIAVGIGFVGYTLHMSLWEMSGYYFGPILYLAGAFIALALTNPQLPIWPRIMVGWTSLWMIAVIPFGGSVLQGIETNQVIRDIRQCVQQYPDKTWMMTGQYLNVFTDEGALRIMQSAQLKDPEWTGTATYVPNATETNAADFDFVIVGPGVDPSTLGIGRTVCQGQLISIVEA